MIDTYRPPGSTHEYDALGRRQPRRLPLGVILGAIPGAADRVRGVPSSAVVQTGEDDDGYFALVKCPCAGHPVTRQSLQKCEGCERYYVATIARVFVVYGDMPIPGALAQG